MIQLVALWLVLISPSIAQNCEQVGCAPGFCCSRWGFCGDSELHCQGPAPTAPPNGNQCNPPCRPDQCCSRWGFCGDSELHCQGDPSTAPPNGNQCNPPCRPGQCCSRWGFCGDSELHCQGDPSTAPPNGNQCNPPCAAGHCCSKWGFCGDSPLHCAGSVAPTTRSSTSAPSTASTNPTSLNPATPGSGGDGTMSRPRFDCIFDGLSPSVRDKRWQGYQEALTMIDFTPKNDEDLMAFFAHVSHETDGLSTYEEYCGQSGACAGNYQLSWCAEQAQPGKQYYGRGWFQLSYPCNYNGAGQALGVDLLGNPEQVAQSDALAAATAMWFWNVNGMSEPAQAGNFGETTRLINKIECGGTPQQSSRVERYQKVRQCFGLPPATANLRC